VSCILGYRIPAVATDAKAVSRTARHRLGTAFRRNFADFSDRLQDSRPRKEQTVDRPLPYRTRALFVPTTADVGSLSQLPALGRERAQAWIDHHLDDLGSRTPRLFRKPATERCVVTLAINDTAPDLRYRSDHSFRAAAFRMAIARRRDLSTGTPPDCKILRGCRFAIHRSTAAIIIVRDYPASSQHISHRSTSR
jgi:hypothetical protein